MLLPGVVAGLLVAPFIAERIDRRRLRYGILLISTSSGDRLEPAETRARLTPAASSTRSPEARSTEARRARRTTRRAVQLLGEAPEF
jgi:hypothetical protein